MRSLAELVAGGLLRLREVSSAQWVLRILMIVGGGGALVLAQLWAPFFFGPALLALGVLALVGSLLAPDSLAGAALVALLVIWWLMAGGQTGLLRTALLGLALALFHLATAWAASGPSRAVMRRALSLRMAQVGLGYLVAVGAGLALMVLVMVMVPSVPWGTIWLALAGALVVALDAAVLQRRH